ncbi:MAG: Ig domain-containing protein, partial [Gemmatimonadetes bacterium]|nr:Ig domain-containing protein [Gemmatimonadota bacterium]
MRLVIGLRFLPLFAGLALTLSLQPACLTNPSGPPTQEPTTITLSTYRIVFTAVNDHVRIDATVLDQDSRVISDATVNWRSADNSVARVTDRGVVTAAGAGTTQITVSSGYATATATVSVEQTADSIEITPSSITLAQVGETGQFTAVVYDANDRIIPGAAMVWSSSNPEIAAVDANGLVTAVAPGDALITASSGGVSTSRPVYVEVAPEPSRIVLNISEATLAAVGQSLQLDAQVYDDNNAAIPGAAVAWSSSRPEVATVDAGGLVIAVSNGTTQVMASSGDASAQATIHVVIEGTEPPDPPSEPERPEPPEPPDPPPPDPD